MENSSGAAHGCWVPMFYEDFSPLLKMINNILALIMIVMIIIPEEFCLREGWCSSADATLDFGTAGICSQLWHQFLSGFGAAVRWESIPKRPWKVRDLLREREEHQEHKTQAGSGVQGMIAGVGALPGLLVAIPCTWIMWPCPKCHFLWGKKFPSKLCGWQARSLEEEKELHCKFSSC